MIFYHLKKIKLCDSHYSNLLEILLLIKVASYRGILWESHAKRTETADGAVVQWQELQSGSCRPGFDPRCRTEGAAEPGALSWVARYRTEGAAEPGAQLGASWG